MCGITGFFTSGKEIERLYLEQMTDRLSHRGPDAAGYYHNGHIGLGHRRLSILDLSDAANQPMPSACGRYMLIFNGEVYNFREIAKDLKQPLKTTGDTEVIIEAFAQWGPDFVSRLNGMFALAIYDKQDNKLYLYRDRIGIKPIYYFFDGDLLVFASELKALRAFLPITDKLTIDKDAVREFLYLGYIPAPHSIYQEVRKFPQGHYAVVDFAAGGMEMKPYFKLEEQVKNQVISNEAEAKKQLNELVNSSVSYRMISDVPFGTFLSGGIDSSLVTAVAQSNSSVPVNTFSIGFKESSFNESGYARQVAEKLGTHHHEFMVSHQEAQELFDDILDVYDEPFADSSSVPTMLVSKLARQHVTMTLSGDGGDETYMGYGFYRWAERLDNPALKLAQPLVAAGLSLGDSRMQRVSHLLGTPGKGRRRSHIFSQEQYYYAESEIDELLMPEWKSGQVDIQEEFEVGRRLSPAESQALFDMKYYLPDDLLVKVDRASMKYSLEARVPLLDHRLVAFALNVDQNLKMRGGTMKYLLKQVLYEYLPKEIFERPKWGFGMPIGSWLKNELRHLPDTYLSEQVVKDAGLVSWPVVNKLLKQYFSGKDYLYNRVWVLILLHKWYLQNQ